MSLLSRCRRSRRHTRSGGEVTLAITLEDHYAAKLGAIAREHGRPAEAIATQLLRNELLRRPVVSGS